MKKLNLTIEDMPYAAEEALNRLRVNIKFCGKNTKKILITSSVPNEGKSTVSVHLWKLLAEAGFPTVLVDVDLRKSEHNTILKMQGVEEGINHYLSGMAEYEDVVYETNIPNGHWVPIAELLENPSALLEDPIKILGLKSYKQIKIIGANETIRTIIDFVFDTYTN